MTEQSAEGMTNTPKPEALAEEVLVWANEWEAAGASTVYTQLRHAATTIATLAAERDALLDLVKGAADIFEHCAVEMGCCCCGDSIETHSIGSGHSPVDQGAYAVDRWQEQYRTTLERTAQP